MEFGTQEQGQRIHQLAGRTPGLQGTTPGQHLAAAAPRQPLGFSPQAQCQSASPGAGDADRHLARGLGPRPQAAAAAAGRARGLQGTTPGQHLAAAAPRQPLGFSPQAQCQSASPGAGDADRHLARGLGPRPQAAAAAAGRARGRLQGNTPRWHLTKFQPPLLATLSNLRPV